MGRREWRGTGRVGGRQEQDTLVQIGGNEQGANYGLNGEENPVKARRWRKELGNP